MESLTATTLRQNTLLGVRGSSHSPDQREDFHSLPEVSPAENRGEKVEIHDKQSAKRELLRRTFGVEAERPALREGEGDDNQSATPTNKSAIKENRSVDIMVDVRATLSVEVAVSEETESDPLALDLDGGGVDTTGVAGGLTFDINGDGVAERTSFIAGGDAFLAYDRNGNGVIDSGRELFGDQNGARDGFEELSRYDQNGDGWIDEKDQIYESLRLVRNRGEKSFDVASSPTLRQGGVMAINTQGRTVDGVTATGADAVVAKSTYRNFRGGTGGAYDLNLKHR